MQADQLFLLYLGMPENMQSKKKLATKPKRITSAIVHKIWEHPYACTISMSKFVAYQQSSTLGLSPIWIGNGDEKGNSISISISWSASFFSAIVFFYSHQPLHFVILFVICAIFSHRNCRFSSSQSIYRRIISYANYPVAWCEKKIIIYILYAAANTNLLTIATNTHTVGRAKKAA